MILDTIKGRLPMALLALMLVGLLVLAGIAACSGGEDEVEEVGQTEVEMDEEVDEAEEVGQVDAGVDEAEEVGQAEVDVDEAEEVGQTEVDVDEVEEEFEKIQVVTTTNFVADWVENVGGDRVDVFSLVPTGADPHGFQPGARDVARIAEADLVFSVGLGLESGWLNELLENAARDESSIIELSDAIETIEFVEIHEEDAELLEHLEELVHEVADGHMTPEAALVEIKKLLAASDDHDDHDHDEEDDHDDHDHDEEDDHDDHDHDEEDDHDDHDHDEEDDHDDHDHDEEDDHDDHDHDEEDDHDDHDHDEEDDHDDHDHDEEDDHDDHDHDEEDGHDHGGEGVAARVQAIIDQVESGAMSLGEAIEEIDHLVHEAEEGHDGHDHGLEDPHFWFDPLRVKLAINSIAGELSAIDAGGSEYYSANAAAYNAQLDELHAWTIEQVRVVPEDNRVLLTSHDSLGYFADRYGFEVVGVILGITTQVEPSAAHMAQLTEVIEKYHVPAVFGETTVSERLAAALAAETGAALVKLYSGSLGAEGSGAETFIGMVRANVESIVDALK